MILLRSTKPLKLVLFVIILAFSAGCTREVKKPTVDKPVQGKARPAADKPVNGKVDDKNKADNGGEKLFVKIYLSNNSADGLVTVKASADKYKNLPFPEAWVLVNKDIPAQAAAGSSIPDKTKILGVRQAGSIAVINLSEEFESGGGSASITLRVAEIVYTLTERQGIKSVQILINGEKVEALGGEGLIIDKPLTRADFPDLAPK